MDGTISAIKTDSRYGFIRGDDGLDRFFHHGSLDKSQPTKFDELEEGMRVRFEPYQLAEPKDPPGKDPSKQHNNLRARRVVVIA